jgi:hypothetical protein
MQWTQNNGRDIASLALTLIPYIGDNNYDIITKLTDIIYSTNENKIPNHILELDRASALKKYFPYSNFTIGLLNESNDILLDLYETNQHTIYTCIENNFISMLETIKITNGKLFVNWLNIIPLVDYRNSNLYNTSINEITSITNLFNDPNMRDPEPILNIINNNKRDMD